MAYKGTIFQTVNEGNGKVVEKPVNFFVEEASYVNGGLTINFPAGWFKAGVRPIVSVAVGLQNLAFAANGLVSHVITALDENLITIRATKGSLVAIIEAATNDVRFQVIAYSPPP